MLQSGKITLSGKSAEKCTKKSEKETQKVQEVLKSAKKCQQYQKSTKNLLEVQIRLKRLHLKQIANFFILILILYLQTIT